MRRILVWVVLLAVCGCGEERRSPALGAMEHESAAPARDRPTEVEMVASMEAHYSAVILAHDALVRGDLEKFRSQLALVPEQALPPSAPEEWLPLHRRIQAAAREAANASDLTTAATTIASVVLACGICHAALDTGPVYPAPAPDDGADAVKNAMLDHQWLTERLWEGVTGPWNNAWERGADALSVVKVFGEENLAVALSTDLLQREQELREIGEKAKNATALDERAALYGRLLATCGECHQAVEVTIEPPK